MTASDFWRRVKVGKNGECWPWKQAVTPDGHGIVRLNGRTQKAHRVAWEMATGQLLLPGAVVRHLCHNPACCNPAHLTLGTHADNVRDRVAARRSACGERNGRAKLSWLDVDDIRAAHRAGEPIGALARRYGVDHQAIRKAVQGETWRPENRRSEFAYK